MSEKSDEEKDFIEVELLDAQGDPIPDEEYELYGAHWKTA